MTEHTKSADNVHGAHLARLGGPRVRDRRVAGDQVPVHARWRCFHAPLLPRKLELAQSARESLSDATARLELCLDAIGVLLAALSFIDRVPRIVHDAIEPQRCSTVLIDLAVNVVPARLAFLAMSAADAALLNLRRKRWM